MNIEQIIKEVIAGIAPVIKEQIALERENIKSIVSAEVSSQFSHYSGIETKLADEKMNSLISKCELEFQKKAYDRIDNALGKIVQPKDGKDGKDALALTDIKTELIGKSIKMTLTDGIDTTEKTIKIPFLEYKEVFNKDKSYEIGDVVTRSGSLWVKTTEDNGIPGDNKSGWKLAVKKGRDGTDGKEIEQLLTKKEQIEIRQLLSKVDFDKLT